VLEEKKLIGVLSDIELSFT